MKPQCAPYFSENTVKCHRVFGDFQVSLHKRQVEEHYTISIFRLYNLQINAETKKNASLRMPESQGVIMFSPNVVQESCVFSIVGFHSGDGYSAVNMQRVLSASTAVFLLLMVLVLEAINWDN
ncbi:uncharacterized protein LOC143242900 isoform X2 [Tachypleus tridentatus]|uniref:uncharacterized protein LOC143242900 isoform X2 n=1 Tax=Tachypleus tridentatus TaxID=6853 RepID=UPI003FCFE8B4